MNQATNLENTIRWPQVWSLIALDVAVIISWIAYHEYQPALLKQFGFDHMTLEFAVVQGIILFLTPPIAGWIADRARKKGGSRLPVMNLGITTVSMIFMVVAFTIFVNPQGWIVNIFPLMVVLWLISMNVFHSPAYSTVELFVPAEKLPFVVAILAVITDLAGAIEPVIVDIIDFFGAPVTFAAGGALVFTTGLLMMRAIKKLTVQGGNEVTASGYSEPIKSDFIFVLGLGLVLGSAVTFLFDITPIWAIERLGFLKSDNDNAEANGSIFAAVVMGIAAIAAFPSGYLAEKAGTGKTAIAGIIVAAAAILAIYYTSGNAAMAFWILFPISFSLMTVSFLPLAFLKLKSAQRVFGIGLFFSGMEVAGSIFNIIQKKYGG